MPKLTERTDRWVTFTEEEIIELLAEKAGVPVKEVSYISYPHQSYNAPKNIFLKLSFDTTARWERFL